MATDNIGIGDFVSASLEECAPRRVLEATPEEICALKDGAPLPGAHAGCGGDLVRLYSNAIVCSRCLQVVTR